MRPKCKSESGFTTLIFLSLLLMLTLLGVNAIMTSTTEVDIAGYELNSTSSLYAAEAGLERGTAALKAQYNNLGVPPATLPSDSIQVGNFGVSYVITKPGTTQSKLLTTGAYRGLYALSDEYIITAVASSANGKAKTTLQMTVDASVVPVYQFAVFYEGDLEIAPGPAMTLGGRVHSNSDMYLESDNSLKIDSYTTAAGDIFHGRAPHSGMAVGTGTVRKSRTPPELTANMKNADNTWLDAQDGDWVTKSIARWDGKVEDKNHGMTELKLPVVASGEPVDMINPAAGSNADSYENKAGLKILDGQVYWRRADSSWQNVTTDLKAAGITTTKVFRDGRENKDVKSSDIDVAKLNTSSYWPLRNRLHLRQRRRQPDATRLVNGSAKGQADSSLENPVYTVAITIPAQKAAAIMTDAYTVLSTSWNDANSTLAKSSRVATATTVNVAYMTGNKVSGAGGGTSYSGGYENLPDSWRPGAVRISHGRVRRFVSGKLGRRPVRGAAATMTRPTVPGRLIWTSSIQPSCHRERH